MLRLFDALENCEGNTFTYTHDYELKELPDKIKFLRKQCEVMHIENCFQLSNITPGIGDLSLLRWLNLSYNNLQELPGTIGKLRNLERLYINNNQLKNLPLELWGLKSLEELHIENNKLSTVPTAILFLPKLREFFCENNPFLTESDINGTEFSTIQPILLAGDCSNCNGRFGRDNLAFISFQTMCNIENIPVVHYCCSEICVAQLKKRLSTL